MNGKGNLGSSTIDVETWMTLDRLLAFKAAADAGGPGPASRGIQAQEDKIRRKIKELSRGFGRPLCESNGSGWKLTFSGNRLRTAVEELSASLACFKSYCDEHQEVSIGAGDRLMQWFFIPRLKQIRPDLTDYTFKLFNLGSAEVVSKVENFTLDFGLIREQDRPRRLGFLKLKHHLNYALFIQKSTDPEQRDVEVILANHPLALVQKYTDEFCDQAKEKGINLQIRLLCSTFPQARRAVLEGYAAILPTSAFTPAELQDIRQIELPASMQSFQKNDGHITLIWNKRIEKMRVDFPKLIKLFEKALVKA
ncbi:MAG TPA: LysR family transcriptional regulator [Verrucomicrobiae bacterium]|jgi:DNA-binding transcriptional LysR family regulator|nr:LysR family transcriptional regulator [Verrucomicrobiae bacterium]